MKLRSLKKWCALAALLCLHPAVGSLYYAGHLADRYYVPADSTLELHCALPVTAAQGGSDAALRLYGIFPIKQVAVEPAEEIRLIPGGAPFGVRMLMDGVMVIGFGTVETPDGSACPALEAGLQEGDVIRCADHVPLAGTAAFREAVARGEPLLLTVERDGTLHELPLTPVFSRSDGWCTGLWVRDSTAGIGTITFYDPETGDFGGLGHPICDPDTGERIPLGHGTADSVTISGAVRGRAGEPGALQGYFAADAPLGTLTGNCESGIFGTLDTPPEGEAVPMAFKQEIRLGDAQILSTVYGTQPQSYDVRITAIDYTDDTRNMILEVTDKDLLALTGGIVQGMSGSPILQDGKLVGAVTHVFVGEPAMGYGIFAETMYGQSRS
ncbi:MAG: SpoIVB peptidase [Oscillospiraceae bacterium]|nr:SpoIVB peptidase [Oscillospiraceae bacterium]